MPFGRQVVSFHQKGFDLKYTYQHLDFGTCTYFIGEQQGYLQIHAVSTERSLFAYSKKGHRRRLRLNP